MTKDMCFTGTLDIGMIYVSKFTLFKKPPFYLVFCKQKSHLFPKKFQFFFVKLRENASISRYENHTKS